MISDTNCFFLLDTSEVFINSNAELSIENAKENGDIQEMGQKIKQKEETSNKENQNSTKKDIQNVSKKDKKQGRFF